MGGSAASWGAVLLCTSQSFTPTTTWALCFWHKFPVFDGCVARLRSKRILLFYLVSSTDCRKILNSKHIFSLLFTSLSQILPNYLNQHRSASSHQTCDSPPLLWSVLGPHLRRVREVRGQHNWLHSHTPLLSLFVSVHTVTASRLRRQYRISRVSAAQVSLKSGAVIYCRDTNN